MEMETETYALALAAVGDREEGFERLCQAIEEIDREEEQKVKKLDLTGMEERKMDAKVYALCPESGDFLFLRQWRRRAKAVFWKNVSAGYRQSLLICIRREFHFLLRESRLRDSLSVI